MAEHRGETKYDPEPAPEAAPETWSELIIWLAEQHHGGKFYAMARHLGRAPALLYQWRDGITRQPDLASIDLIARTYRLERARVMEVALSGQVEANGLAAPITPSDRTPLHGFIRQDIQAIRLALSDVTAAVRAIEHRLYTLREVAEDVEALEDGD